MSNAHDFIADLANKLGRPTPSSVQPVEVDVPHFRLGSQEEQVTVLLANWDSLGGRGIAAKTPEEAAEALKGWFGDPEPPWLDNTEIAIWGELPPFIARTLETLGWKTFTYADASRDRAERITAIAGAQLGITGADYGIVQSGSLVLRSQDRRGRAVSLVPPRHLAFLAASRIRDELGQVMEELLTDGPPPAAVEIISGPSRTSDIEMDLSIGVHGPIEVYLVIMTDQ